MFLLEFEMLYNQNYQQCKLLSNTRSSSQEHRMNLDTH